MFKKIGCIKNVAHFIILNCVKNLFYVKNVGFFVYFNLIIRLKKFDQYVS